MKVDIQHGRAPLSVSGSNAQPWRSLSQAARLSTLPTHSSECCGEKLKRGSSRDATQPHGATHSGAILIACSVQKASVPRSRSQFIETGPPCSEQLIAVRRFTRTANTECSSTFVGRGWAGLNCSRSRPAPRVRRCGFGQDG